MFLLFFYYLYILLFYYLGIQISKYFFPEVLKIQQVFVRVAKYSYNSCEFHNEIPKNYFFMIFLLKVAFFPKTLWERGYMYHTRMTPHTYVDPVATTRLELLYFSTVTMTFF
jgi:hypothetical protein